MAVSFVTQANRDGGGSDANVSTHTITRPVTLLIGDVAVFFLVIWTSNPAITAPSGAVARANVANGVVRTHLYLKYIAAETSWTFSWTGANWSTLQALFFRGVDTGLDLATVPFNSANASGTSFGTTTVTTITDAGMAWGGNTIDYSSSITHTPPTNFTEVLDFDSHAAAYRISPGDGNQSASGATISGSETNLAVLVALAPAGGGTVVTGTAQGSYGFTGTVSGVRAAAGAAAGSYGFTAAAAGVRRVLAVTAGVFGFTGTATGSRRVNGTAVGIYGYVGTAAGVVSGVVVGTAQGSYGFAGVAAGIRRVLGTASGSYGFQGTAVGVIEGVVTGTAQGSYGYTGTATGARTVLGVASGVYGFIGIVVVDTTDPNPDVLDDYQEPAFQAYRQPVIGAYRETSTLTPYQEAK